MLVFENDIEEQICSHAQTEYPRECCGIMLGKHQKEKRQVYRIIPTRNVVEGGKNTTQFLINPFVIVKAELAAEKEGLEIVGFYHSHPDYRAVTSEEDILHMIAGYSYLIVSVVNGVSVEIKGFEKLFQTDIDVKEETLTKEK